jgi:Cu+-exporting ATPase
LAKALLYPEIQTVCYHCGDGCISPVETDGHLFCCEGCRQVFLLLQQNKLCSYYDFDKQPGLKARGKFTGSRFAYLDDESVIDRLALFRSKTRINLSFSLPQMHCASCIYLLENLHRIENGVMESRVNFDRKELYVSFDPQNLSLRKLVETLAFIGYEPSISLDAVDHKPKNKFNRTRILQLGVAGFCFSNIMMLSFPEYFSGGQIETKNLQGLFTGIIFVLSIPVLFYSAYPIFQSAWKSLRQGIVNIDAPIAFASIMTFGRSYYEILSGTGAGYLDSGTGIIFFMLIGRWFQSRSYDAISFEKQYRSYFPLGITVLRMHKEESIPLTKLEKGDTIIIRNEEMIPADAVLVEGEAYIDYSFVSGENEPVFRKAGDIIYAGGKQVGAALKLSVIKLPSESYFTELWNNDAFQSKKRLPHSFIHPWSRYFTWVLLGIAGLTAIYWGISDQSKLWSSVTAVLIVACPCSLLLSATFTFGHMQRILGRSKLFLKNAGVIESLAAVTQIVFDKTGTITKTGVNKIQYFGTNLNSEEKKMIRLLSAQSVHPLGRALFSFLADDIHDMEGIRDFKEVPGEGMQGVISGQFVQLGSAKFVGATWCRLTDTTVVHVSINQIYKGYFEIANDYRIGISNMMKALKRKGYALHLLSGDNDGEKHHLRELLGIQASLNFNYSPQQKLDYIKSLRSKGEKILMIGDGLNDAGALMEADCSIAISDDTSRFSPACDGILQGDRVHKMADFLGFARMNNRIVAAGFALSILYNFIGLGFAVQGNLSPLIAAVLMPCSSISIILVAWALSSRMARRYHLRPGHDNDQSLH